MTSRAHLCNKPASHAPRAPTKRVGEYEGESARRAYLLRRRVERAFEPVRYHNEKLESISLMEVDGDHEY